jgi:hypothetical protein
MKFTRTPGPDVYSLDFPRREEQEVDFSSTGLVRATLGKHCLRREERGYAVLSEPH